MIRWGTQCFMRPGCSYIHRYLSDRKSYTYIFFLLSYSSSSYFAVPVGGSCLRNQSARGKTKVIFKFSFVSLMS